MTTREAVAGLSGATPGPWEIESNPETGESIITADGWEIAKTFGSAGDGPGEDESLANGLLVAGAPEMLAALIGVVRVADRATPEFDAARAAISKASPSLNPASMGK